MLQENEGCVVKSISGKLAPAELCGLRVPSEPAGPLCDRELVVSKLFVNRRRTVRSLFVEPGLDRSRSKAELSSHGLLRYGLFFFSGAYALGIAHVILYQLVIFLVSTTLVPVVRQMSISSLYGSRCVLVLSSTERG
jgi:hypothetical protein